MSDVQTHFVGDNCPGGHADDARAAGIARTTGDTVTELRAPDPTLTECEPDRLVEVDLSHVLPVAHHQSCEAAPRGLAAHGVEAQHARWFAVPCRDCFPDAPPPGGGHDADCGIEGCRAECGPVALAWQVAS